MANEVVFNVGDLIRVFVEKDPKNIDYCILISDGDKVALLNIETYAVYSKWIEAKPSRGVPYSELSRLISNGSLALRLGRVQFSKIEMV